MHYGFSASVAVKKLGALEGSAFPRKALHSRTKTVYKGHDNPPKRVSLRLRSCLLELFKNVSDTFLVSQFQALVKLLSVRTRICRHGQAKGKDHGRPLAATEGKNGIR